MTGKTADAYFTALVGPLGEAAADLRRDILALGLVTESLKWGHPVYDTKRGPVALIKTHKGHVTFGLWRGAQMGELDSRLEPGGGFQMAYIRLTAPGEITATEVRRLILQGVVLNDKEGDPTKTLSARRSTVGSAGPRS